MAYFNAGVRVVDLSDPYNLKEVGYYVPKTNALSHPITKGQPTAIQINDVDIDHRGLAYASDRVGSGLFILEYTGPKSGPLKAAAAGLRASSGKIGTVRPSRKEAACPCSPEPASFSSPPSWRPSPRPRSCRKDLPAPNPKTSACRASGWRA